MRKINAIRHPGNMLSLFIVLVLATPVSFSASDGSREARKGGRWGAKGGAILGLALGAATGDKKMMAAGAATGALVGGASGAMYEYDQSRDDKRNKELADAIGGSRSNTDANTNSNSNSNSNTNTVQVTSNPLEGFIGDWNVNAWGIMPDGEKVIAVGQGKGVLTASNTAKVDYFDIKADGYEQSLSGYAIIDFDDKDGLKLTTYGADNKVDAKFVGEHIAEQKKFNFYLTNSQQDKTVTGILKSDLRLEVRVSGTNLMFVDTYTFLKGKETQIQSYRFSKK